MPFVCEARLEPTELRHGSITFDSWIEDAWDHYIEAGTAFATGHDVDGSCVLRLTGPGKLTAKPEIQSGEVIGAGIVVAYFAADGEDIPYGKPYCRVEYETPTNVGLK